MTVATESMLDERGQPRQEAIVRVVENAGDAWKAAARAWLEGWLRSHEYLEPDAAREHGCPVPHDWRAVGSIIQRAKRDGWIERCGLAKRANGTEAPRYRSLLYGGPR